MLDLNYDDTKNMKEHEGLKLERKTGLINYAIYINKKHEKMSTRRKSRLSTSSARKIANFWRRTTVARRKMHADLVQAITCFSLGILDLMFYINHSN